MTERAVEPAGMPLAGPVVGRIGHRATERAAEPAGMPLAGPVVGRIGQRATERAVKDRERVCSAAAHIGRLGHLVVPLRQMSIANLLTRRTFLVHAGRGSIALVVLGVAGCGPSAVGSAGTPSDAGEPSSGAEQTSPPASAPPSAATGGVTWHRANLGFVSAYVLARAGEAAIVDTGVAGSEGAIADALTAAGLGWDAVGHVILTHRHGDHAGSIDAILGAAPDAAA